MCFVHLQFPTIMSFNFKTMNANTVFYLRLISSNNVRIEKEQKSHKVIFFFLFHNIYIYVYIYIYILFTHSLSPPSDPSFLFFFRFCFFIVLFSVVLSKKKKKCKPIYFGITTPPMLLFFVLCGKFLFPFVFCCFLFCELVPCSG